MKILHIITGLGPGGAESMLKRLILSDPSTLSDKIVVSLTALEVIGKELCAQGVEVHAMEMSSVLGFPGKFFQLCKLIKQSKPDIIQTWMYHADLLGGLAARLSGFKNIIWGIRIQSVPANNPKTALVVKISALLSRWIPKKILCVAESAREEHIKYGYDAERMVVVHNGFDFSHFTVSQAQKSVLREECGFSSEDFVVGWLGRFHSEKGQENFIKAAKIVSVKYPKTKFLLIGRRCNAENATLMGWLTDVGLQDQFVLLGERRDAPACLAIMDLFCMPSSNEGFPNALGEAMASGLPCVATEVGDAAVLASDTVIMVPPENEQALAEGMLKIMALSREQRLQMGEHSKAWVMSEFSIDTSRQRFEAVYLAMLADC